MRPESEAAEGRLPMAEDRAHAPTARAGIPSVVAASPHPLVDSEVIAAWVAVPFLLLTLAAFS